MVRVLLAVPLIALDTLVFGSAAVLAGLLDRTGRLCRHLARAWARVLLRGLGVRVEVTGGGNVPPGPAVYAANHGSALDIPILFGYAWAVGRPGYVTNKWVDVLIMEKIL